MGEVIEGNQKIALLDAIKDAASDRAKVPKMSLGYVSAMLAFSLLVVREYDGTWPIITILASVSVPFLLVATASLAMRVTSLGNIETLGASEMFEGRLPDPEGADYQNALANHRRIYRLSGRIGGPAISGGVILLALTTLTVVCYHLLK